MHYVSVTEQSWKKLIPECMGRTVHLYIALQSNVGMNGIYKLNGGAGFVAEVDRALFRSYR